MRDAVRRRRTSTSGRARRLGLCSCMARCPGDRRLTPVGRLRHRHGRTLKQKLAALEPFERGLGLSRPRLPPAGVADWLHSSTSTFHLLERQLRGRLTHGHPLSGLLPGLVDLDDHAIIAAGLHVSQLEAWMSVEEALAVSDHDREDHQPELVRPNPDPTGSARAACCRARPHSLMPASRGHSDTWSIAGPPYDPMRL